MDNNKPLGVAGITAAAVAALVLGGGFYLAQTDAEEHKEIIVTPDKPTVVKEGFSGSRSPVVVSHKEFTGGGSKIVQVYPDKPKIITGYSKAPTPVKQEIPVKTPALFPNAKPFKVPDRTPLELPEVGVVVDGLEYTCTPER